MDLQLQGKRALVTGSTSGIGEATVKLLAAEGAVVAVHGRNTERAEQVAADIRSSGGKAVVAIGDLADESQALSVAEKVDSELDGIDILFNNAGGGGRRSENPNPGFLDLTPEDWAGEYEHNVLSAVRMIRHFVPGMKARGWGRIIQNASASATSPSDTVSDYAAAKAAVVNLTVGLAKALALTGITVNTVSPGLTLTPQALSPAPGKTPWLRAFAKTQGWDDTLPLNELERRWAEARAIPAGHCGRVEDIASAVAFLASPLGGYINGANLRVDGGQNKAVN